MSYVEFEEAVLSKAISELKPSEANLESWKFEDGQEDTAFVDGFEHALDKVEALLFGQPAPGHQEAGCGASPATMVSSSVEKSAPGLLPEHPIRQESADRRGKPEQLSERSSESTEIIDLMKVIKRHLGME